MFVFKKGKVPETSNEKVAFFYVHDCINGIVSFPQHKTFLGFELVPSRTKQEALYQLDFKHR